MNPSTESPCIGICSTVYGDDICRGCKRHYLEVIDWNRYDAAQKQAINARLQQQIETITALFVVIEDPRKLKTQLDKIALRPPIYLHPLCWAYELLRLKSQHITTLSEYGLRARPPYDALTVNGLFTALDDHLYKFVTAV